MPCLYRNPKYAAAASFVPYTKVLLGPVKLHGDASSKLHDAPQEQINAIAQGFYQHLHEQLSKDYQIVDTPGPNTLQISVAVVDAQQADASLKAASYIPIPLGFSGAKRYWAELLRYRLCMRRGVSDCVKASE